MQGLLVARLVLGIEAAGLAYLTRFLLGHPVRFHVVSVVQAITPDYQSVQERGLFTPCVSSLLHQSEL